MSLRLLTLVCLFLSLSLAVLVGSPARGIGIVMHAIMPAFVQSVEAASEPLPQTWGGITLLQPLGDTRSINVNSGIGTFINYFNDATSWLLTVVVGICVLWVLIGGFQIMLSGGFSGMDAAGKNHMTWAIAGLAITLFAGFILRLLNSMFFT